MTDYLSYGGVQAVDVSLAIPFTGLWTADLGLASDAAAPSQGTLVLGNLSLQGAVWRQGTRWGQTHTRLAGGFGGWSKVLPARGYALPFGVLLSLVLNDAALSVGEQVAVQSDRMLGNFWVRPAGPAGRLLRSTSGEAWWVNSAGVVQVGPRAGVPITSSFDVEEWDAAAGIMTVATEDPASWQPANTFSSPVVQPTQTIAFVRHAAGQDGRTRMRVMVQ